MESAAKKRPSQTMVLCIVMLGVLCGATASIFIRYGTAPTLVLAAYRKTIVTVLLLPSILLHHRTELKQLHAKTLLWCLLAGVFLAIHFFTYFMSVKYTTITASNVLAGTEILFVSLCMYFFGKEKYSRMCKVGIALALIGSVLVSITGSNNPAVNAPFGNFCGIMCAGMLAAYSLVGTKIRRENISNTLFTFLAYGASAVVLNLLVACSGYSFFGYGKMNLLIAFGMAVLCSLFCHSLYTWSLEFISPTLLAIFKMLAPIPTAVLGFLVFGEMPTGNQVVGGMIVILGICVYTLYASKTEQG